MFASSRSSEERGSEGWAEWTAVLRGRACETKAAVPGKEVEVRLGEVRRGARRGKDLGGRAEQEQRRAEQTRPRKQHTAGSAWLGRGGAEGVAVLRLD